MPFHRYIDPICRALISALVKNGVAFEAHAQNVLAKYDITSKEVRTFVIRDMGGLRVHPPTLRESTGFISKICRDMGLLPPRWKKFYLTFVHNHIQRLISLTGLRSPNGGFKMFNEDV
ncbi:hypothetical protein CPB83DRAFT_860608 [Crepidotus variabilis]|uniref:Aerobactin siderophore biosynthesis IucA/IucC-like C-terminal domain-containing protein n=1 Tax=Crepidotus variabilis TaxID=179855 RepID=A0A9P6E8U9_9AGAR|nr:hypothetical protein CPB83DRAFT_860608 [Crepidotus variabilis]